MDAFRDLFDNWSYVEVPDEASADGIGYSIRYKGVEKYTAREENDASWLVNILNNREKHQ